MKNPYDIGIREDEVVNFEDMNFGESYDKMLALQNQAYKNGYEIGYEEGLKLAKEARAKIMLKNKIDIEMISKYTGLSKEEIKNLYNEMHPIE